MKNISILELAKFTLNQRICTQLHERVHFLSWRTVAFWLSSSTQLETGQKPRLVLQTSFYPCVRHGDLCQPIFHTCTSCETACTWGKSRQTCHQPSRIKRNSPGQTINISRTFNTFSHCFYKYFVCPTLGWDNFAPSFPSLRARNNNFRGMKSQGRRN